MKCLTYPDTWAVEYALAFFWIAAIALVFLRRCSSVFARIAAYGGRNLPHPGNKASELKINNGTKLPRARTMTGLLLLQRVSRRHAFQSFYAVGVLSCVGLGVTYAMCAVLPLPAAVWEAARFPYVPCIMFAMHCAVRWVESTFRQRYRSSGDDVTLFAALSGSGFYLAAALSSVHWGTRASPEVLDATPMLAMAHVALQIIQVHHHEILRRLRTSQRGNGATNVYRFPNGQGLFSVVQEPHYLCEFLMYVVQWLMLVLSLGGIQLPALLVACFTMCNLSVTALEHRSYWRTIDGDQLPRWVIVPWVW